MSQLNGKHNSNDCASFSSFLLRHWIILNFGYGMKDVPLPPCSIQILFIIICTSCYLVSCKIICNTFHIILINIVWTTTVPSNPFILCSQIFNVPLVFNMHAICYVCCIHLVYCVLLSVTSSRRQHNNDNNDGNNWTRRTKQRASKHKSDNRQTFLFRMFNLRLVNFDWLSCVFHTIFNGFNYGFCKRGDNECISHIDTRNGYNKQNIRESKNRNEHFVFMINRIIREWTPNMNVLL